MSSDAAETTETTAPAIMTTTEAAAETETKNVDASSPHGASASKKRKAVLTANAVEEYRARAAARGVIYVSRVPPYMKPEKLKHLLAKFGEIHRVYLVPEDKVQHRKRVTSGGNRRTKYTEGWVEFAEKRVARRVAEMLNTKQIGGRKRDYYHDDIWNLKYLKGFKWEHLTEKIAYENRIRDQKLRMEIAQSKKENDEYLERVEKSKAFAKMDERKAGTERAQSAATQMRRTFQQKEPTSSKRDGGADSAHGELDLLQHVFAKKRKVATTD